MNYWGGTQILFAPASQDLLLCLALASQDLLLCLALASQDLLLSVAVPVPLPRGH